MAIEIVEKVTTDQFCKREGISRSTYFRLRDRGKLPRSYRIGKRIFHDISDIEIWREKQKQHNE